MRELRQGRVFKCAVSICAFLAEIKEQLVLLDTYKCPTKHLFSQLSHVPGGRNYKSPCSWTIGKRCAWANKSHNGPWKSRTTGLWCPISVKGWWGMCQKGQGNSKCCKIFSGEETEENMSPVRWGPNTAASWLCSLGASPGLLHIHMEALFPKGWNKSLNHWEAGVHSLSLIQSAVVSKPKDNVVTMCICWRCDPSAGTGISFRIEFDTYSDAHGAELLDSIGLVPKASSGGDTTCGNASYCAGVFERDVAAAGAPAASPAGIGFYQSIPKTWV